MSDYRGHAERLDRVIGPETFPAYLTHFLAEQHMTRLACLALKGGQDHVRAFLGLLDDERPGVRYTAALHAVNRGMDRAAGFETLRELAAGKPYSSSARQALRQRHEPLHLDFDANIGLDAAFDVVHKHRGRLRPAVKSGPRR